MRTIKGDSASASERENNFTWKRQWNVSREKDDALPWFGTVSPRSAFVRYARVSRKNVRFRVHTCVPKYTSYCTIYLLEITPISLIYIVASIRAFYTVYTPFSAIYLYNQKNIPLLISPRKYKVQKNYLQKFTKLGRFHRNRSAIAESNRIYQFSLGSRKVKRLTLTLQLIKSSCN